MLRSLSLGYDSFILIYGHFLAQFLESSSDWCPNFFIQVIVSFCKNLRRLFIGTHPHPHLVCGSIVCLGLVGKQ